jgi:hypothetical protein
MHFPKLLLKGAATFIFALSGQIIFGQSLIKGTVYDRSLRIPLRGVSVLATSGTGTMTDSLGHYHISLMAGDSIYFSYLGRATSKSPVQAIDPDLPFDMSLQVSFDPLVPVLAMSKVHIPDSMDTRAEYKKVFDYQADYFQGLKSRSKQMGLGLNLDLIVDAKASNRILTLQQRLEQDEQENYVDRHFTKDIVQKITGIMPPLLDSFMRLYRPSYEFIKTFNNDFEFYKYISNCGKTFAKNQ